MSGFSLWIKRVLGPLLALGLILAPGLAADGGQANIPSASGAKQPSIYEAIRGALDVDGRLPSDFVWPPPAAEESFSMAPGAMDGIMIYHMNSQRSAESEKELLGLIKKAVQDNSGPNTEAVIKILNEHSTLSIIDGLLAALGEEEQRGITPRQLTELAQDWASKGREVELVKLGIALLGIIDADNNEDIRNIIQTLGKYEELALFSMVAMGRWADGNRMIFDLARQLEGWGQVHAVERLRPESPEIKEWFITGGCGNMLTGLYSAATCALKGDLVGHLKSDEISEAVFKGSGDIVSAFLDADGPVDHLAAYAQADEAMVLYLAHAVRHCRTPEQLHLAKLVKNHLIGLEDDSRPAKSRAEIIARYDKIVAGRDWPATIVQTINPDAQPGEVHFACLAAEDLGIDISGPLFDLIKIQPLEHVFQLPYLYANEDMAEKATAFYEQFLLPEPVAAAGPERETQLEAHNRRLCLQLLLQSLKPYPALGLPLLKAGLKPAAGGSVSQACETLEAWLAAKDGATLASFDAGLPSLVQEVHDRQQDEALRVRLKALLDGSGAGAL